MYFLTIVPFFPSASALSSLCRDLDLEPIHYLPPSLKPLFLATKLRLVRTIINYGSYSDLFFHQLIRSLFIACAFKSDRIPEFDKLGKLFHTYQMVVFHIYGHT